MQTVVILGAKPGARLPAGDAIYAANAAVMGHESDAAAFVERVTVASALVLARGLVTGSAHDTLYSSKLQTVSNSGFGRLVLFSDPGSRDLTKAALAYLDGSHSEGTTVWSVLERRALVAYIGQCGYPVIDRTLWSQPLPVVIRDLSEIAKLRLGWLMGDTNNDCRAKYRPSTGILALLVAIAERGTTARYVISGIGFEDRNKFLIDGKILCNKSNGDRMLPKHVQADIILLRALSRRYRIETTEAELLPLLPPFEDAP